MRRKIILSVFVALLIACSGGHLEWSEQDKKNIRHFYTSREANQAAIAISNSGVNIPFSEYIKLQQLALEEAHLVQDSVLSKAHPGMREPYRNLYQASLSGSIQAYENSDNALSVKASSLHDQWVDWFNANRNKIRIPK